MQRNALIARTCTALVCLAAIAIAGASGCARTVPPSPPPRSAAQWRASTLRPALPAVLVVRGRTLGVQKLDSTETVPLWTAPAETTPTILAVDQAGGRIAVLLRAAPTITFAPAGRFIYPPRWSDAGIVVLSADGSTRRFRVVARATPIHVVVRTTSYPSGGWSISVTRSASSSLVEEPGTLIRSIDATVPDLVTSGAFAGRDLVLTTQKGSDGRWGPTAGTPLLMAPDGQVRPLVDEASATLGPVDQLCQLKGGQALAARGAVTGPFNTNRAASLAEVRGSALVTASPLYAVGWQWLGPVASADETASFVYHYQGYVLNEFVVTSLANGGWRTQAIPARWDLGPIGVGRWRVSVDFDLAKAGPGDALLVPVAHGTKKAPAYSATTARLTPIRPDGSIARNVHVSVDVMREDDPRTSTWAYVEHFGR
jgi:hypothetical protein